jgi:hypothetical protein
VTATLVSGSGRCYGCGLPARFVAYLREAGSRHGLGWMNFAMIVQLAPGVSPEPDGMVMTHSCWKAAPPCERKSHRVGIGYPLSASVRSSCSKAEAIQSIWLLRIPCLSGFVTPLRDGFGHLSGLENGASLEEVQKAAGHRDPQRHQAL